jgi:hypothetical protein
MTSIFINPFLRLSHFEMFALGGFISRFPTTATTLAWPFPEGIIKTGMIFEAFEHEKNWPESFDNYMRTLASNNLGLCDMFWWLPPQLFTSGKPFDSALLWKYIKCATFETGKLTKHHQLITIKNTLHPEFSVVSYFKNQSLPGETMDVVPCFVTPDGKMYSALAYKDESARIPVKLGSGDVINVLQTGIFGNVICSDDILPSAKSDIDKLRVSWKDTDKQPIFISNREITSTMRTITEAAGLKATNAELFYVSFSQTDSEPCRDIRYSRIYDGSILRYGYPIGRISSAHTLCYVVHCEPRSNPIPEDQKECGESIILPVSSIRKNFRVGGLFEPAFPEHVEQMTTVLNFIEKYGPTFNLEK